jgi:two-component system CheB/CheR fusion protein
VRDLCVFAKHDVARDPPFSSMDLISCRNLMIYLGPTLQDRVIGLLHYALNDSGFLLLGASETVRATAGFSSVDGKNKIYARTSGAARRAFDFTTPRSSPDVVAPPLAPQPSGPSDVHREADRLVLAKFAPAGVVVTADLTVIQFRGHTGPYLEHAAGVASLELLRTVREELRLPLRRAIDRARSTEAVTRETGVVVAVADQRRVVALEVIPFALRAAPQRYFLVLFEDVTPQASIEVAERTAPPPEADTAAEDALRDELASTRQYLESVIEQLEVANEDLKAANEEIVSSNEELRSTNEELQSAKEELQATNEELRTVNDEMRDRSVEATRLSDDLANVLTSIEIPILIAGRDARLQRFTPAAGRAFGLRPTDLEHPIEELRPIVSIAPTLPGIVGKVLDQLQPFSVQCRDAGGHWYELWVRPYVTLDGRIDGTVIVARDLDAEKKLDEYQARIRRMAFDATLTEERERRRLAVEIHDRMGQTLALAQIKLASVRRELTGEARTNVEAAVELLEQAIADQRAVVFDLSPPLLYDLGLKEALAWFAEDFEKRHASSRSRHPRSYA